MSNSRNVLITGGTKGIGLSMALEFARTGSQCVLTYNWGSVDDDVLLEQFVRNGYRKPILVQANVIDDNDTESLMRTISERVGHIDVFISNVSFSSLVNGLDDYNDSALYKSIEYSAWPLISYLKALKSKTDRYPRYVFGLSSFGPERFHKSYDFAAITKSVLEVFIRYLNYQFFKEDVIFNVIKTRPIVTDSLISTLGEAWREYIETRDIDGTQVSCEDIGKLAVMMASGLMDAVRGEVIVADRGFGFADGMQHDYVTRFL